MKKYKVGIIGGTGMVGQRFVTLMEDHPPAPVPPARPMSRPSPAAGP